jgi:hypothetical protein
MTYQKLESDFQMWTTSPSDLSRGETVRLATVSSLMLSMRKCV